MLCSNTPCHLRESLVRVTVSCSWLTYEYKAYVSLTTYCHQAPLQARDSWREIYAYCFRYLTRAAREVIFLEKCRVFVIFFTFQQILTEHKKRAQKSSRQIGYKIARHSSVSNTYRWCNVIKINSYHRKTWKCSKTLLYAVYIDL